MDSFDQNCAIGIEANLDVLRANMERSLMLVTALNPHIGYENARPSQKAHKEGTTLREAALASGSLRGEDFDRIVRPEEMIHPKE